MTDDGLAAPEWCRYNSLENPIGIETTTIRRGLRELWCYNSLENPIGIETHLILAIYPAIRGYNSLENPIGIETRITSGGSTVVCEVTTH